MTRELQVWLNGEMVPESQATVPLSSHAVSRASAIFEIFGVHEGPRGPMAFRMDEHLKRLLRSARLLEMELSYDTQAITDAVRSTVRCKRPSQWTHQDHWLLGERVGGEPRS